jgi:hypothetical protein
MSPKENAAKDGRETSNLGSTDFILGRIFESVQDYALKEVVKSKDGVNERSVQALIASNKFRGANCSLLRGN